MDDADVTRREWADKGVYSALDELYSEIWVYGNQDLYDPIHEYAIPAAVSAKVRFTGYIPRKVPSPEGVQNARKENGLQEGDKLVVVTTGGGGDGYEVMDAYLRMLEAGPPPAFKSILITGPFMPKRDRKNLNKRCRKLGVRMHHFYRQMEKIFAAADLVICMGGYNTLCEILSQGTVSLVVPRDTPRREQLIRAETFQRQRLIDYIPWDALTPERMRDKVDAIIADPQPLREAIARFPLTGIETMRQRLKEFRCGRC
jgi:predicted glycosyltransferase